MRTWREGATYEKAARHVDESIEAWHTGAWSYFAITRIGSSAARKWMPDQTRASTISSIACEKRVQLRVSPALLVSLQATLSVPKKSCSVATIEPLKPACPDGCSGYGGVGINGNQAGSASV